MSNDFVAVTSGRCIYIGVKDKQKFDSIERPMVNCENNVLAKLVEQNGVKVIFQYQVCK